MKLFGILIAAIFFATNVSAIDFAPDKETATFEHQAKEVNSTDATVNFVEQALIKRTEIVEIQEFVEIEDETDSEVKSVKIHSDDDSVLVLYDLCSLTEK